MNVEAVVLTGGASRRMGSSKANLPVDGVPLATRIVSTLLENGFTVTVLGREPIAPARFVPDTEEFGGPLSALAKFQPTREFVFVASCDLPLFNGRIVELLLEHIGPNEAAIPFIQNRLQPLCALYRSSTFENAVRLSAGGQRRVMTWVEGLTIASITNIHFIDAVIDPNCALGVNTPEEFIDALSKRITSLSG